MLQVMLLRTLAIFSVVETLTLVGWLAREQEASTLDDVSRTEPLHFLNLPP
jgi:hypothetical protein